MRISFWKKITVWGAVFILILVVLFFCSSEIFNRVYRGFFAGLMPLETVTPESLEKSYSQNQLKILLVPGHSNADGGAEFRGVSETEINLKVAQSLFDFLRKDGHFQVFTVRDLTTGEYAPIFASYFTGQEKEIVSFRNRVWETFKRALNIGAVRPYTNIQHNMASEEMSQKLYGINKWANEQKIDIVLHLHFNDYAGRNYEQIGDYSGLAIYFPESQFSNSRASAELGKSLFTQFKNYFAVSDLTGESQGLIPDGELIALGANGSLDAAALLIEYGYIYEPQFRNSEIAKLIFPELAWQTYLGLKRYFEPNFNSEETTFLPYQWNKILRKGLNACVDVLVLQSILHRENLYPPPGKTLSDCPLNGNFGDCTEAGVKLFQEKYAEEILQPFGFSQGTGIVGPATLKKLNDSQIFFE